MEDLAIVMAIVLETLPVCVYLCYNLLLSENLKGPFSFEVIKIWLPLDPDVS